MNDEKLAKIEEAVQRLTNVLSLVRVAGGILTAIVGAIIAVVLWVNNTTTALANTQMTVDNFKTESSERLKEWAAWRVQKDEVDTKMLTLMSGQQDIIRRILDRQDKLVEKVGDKSKP